MVKFRFTFTSRDRFITDILSLPGSHSELWQELVRTDLSSRLKEKLENQPASPGRGPMGDEAELLYILTRLVKPEFVVETGVGAGYSTSHILTALDSFRNFLRVCYYPVGYHCCRDIDDW